MGEIFLIVTSHTNPLSKTVFSVSVFSPGAFQAPGLKQTAIWKIAVRSEKT